MTRCLVLGVYLMAGLAAQSAAAQWSVPEEFVGQLSALDEQQRAFVASGAVLEFIPRQQMEHELATRDARSLSKLIDELMALAALMQYDPERDMGAAPLNLKSKRFNSPPLPTPAPLRDLERDPGPFSVSRYLFPQSGVPTFGGAKVAIWPEDLTAGDVDVAIIGVPNNMSSGRRDAGNGPGEMRVLDTIGNPDGKSLLKPLEVLNVVDYGDFAVDFLSTERTVEHVTYMVAETAGTGAIPMMVGGDTSMLYPGVKGVSRAHGPGTFGLLHFSAHSDVERFGDHTVSDRQALYLLIEEGVVDGPATIQVGIRGPSVDASSLQWMREQKVRYHTMAEIEERGFESVLERVLEEVGQGPEKFFVSIDVSAITPAEMTAAGRVVANGLHVEDASRTIRHVCASKDLVGFEITDLAPMLDLTRTSVINANAVLNACLVGIAVRKAGLDPDYIHPLVLDHGQ